MSGDLSYHVRWSDRARRVRVSVDAHDGVEVVLPRRSPQSAAAAAVVELRPWIDRRLAETSVVRAMVAARGDTVPYLGAHLRLVPEAGRTRVQRRSLPGSPSPAGDVLLVPAGADAARAALERWFRRAARDEIVPRLDHAVAALGCSYGALSIRNQRTRWGSCSAGGAMSFNWRLLLAPEPVLDYVVWHEACHLRVLDHSAGFWELVRLNCPRYQEQRRWLRRLGATLVL